MKKIVRSYILEKSENELRIFLKDLVAFGGLHPLVFFVKKETGLGDNLIFRVFEKPYTFLPFTINYTVKVIEDGEKITYEITGVPMHNVFIHYITKSLEDNKTQVELNISIKGIPFNESMMMKKMIQAQDHVMMRFEKM